jgi:hypothetical protein
MRNYDHVWGGAYQGWNTIKFQDQHLSTAFTILAWAGMICFFVFGIFSLVTRSDEAALLMLAALIVWVTSGIIVIRVRRRGRKLVTFSK